MTKIVHISDIHWRGATRHDEYRRAFSSMFDELRIIKPDFIFVGGDIVHSKTQGITPELIDNLVWWFREMAKICEVHVILGNHDGLILNQHRQDAISPIITALDNPRVKLYKKSGVYNFAPGFNWCVFSVFDEEGWDTVKPVAGQINIALYHGAVAGSVSDQNYELEADLKVEFFKDFEFCFLGDIHKQQFLGYRDGKPWIAFPGSSIQQSFGEVGDKGYLLWDIRSATDYDVEFKVINHDRKFVTVDWKGTIDETLKDANIPKGARVRVKSDGAITNIDVQHVTNELIRAHDASEVIFKDVKYSTASGALATGASHHENLRDVDVQLKLFHDFYHEKLLSQNEWAALKVLIANYMRRALENDMTTRNVTWTLDDLSFSNLFGYGENNSINFKKMSGITGIFGPNRIGKSSIIGTLLYALFNDTDRGAIKNLHIINAAKDSCKCELTLSSNNAKYKIQRQSIRNTNKQGVQNAVTSLNFFQISGDSVKELNGEQRTDTEKIIRSIVGSADDLMLTGIATQGDMNKFVMLGSTQRDQMMSRFLDLDIFEKMHSLAKADANTVFAQLSNAPDRDWNALINANVETMNALQVRLTELEGKARAKRVLLDEINVQLATMKQVVSRADVENTEKRIKIKESDIKKLHEDIRTATQSIAEGDEKLQKINDRLSNLDVASLQEKRSAHIKLKDAFTALKHALETEKTQLSNQRRSALKLADVPCGDAFPNCKFIRDSHIDKANIVSQEMKVNQLVSAVGDAQKRIEEIDAAEIDKAINEHSDLLQKQTKLITLIERANSSKHVISSNLGAAEATLDELRVLYDKQRLELDESSDDRLDAVKREKSALEDEMSAIDKERISKSANLGTLKSENERLVSERDQYKQLREKWKIYDMFMTAVAKNGIPARILQQQLPVINAEIARILQNVANFSVSIVKDAVTNSTDVIIDDGSPRLLELASGMEKMVSSLAIRVALLSASTLPKPDFLIIDEGFGALDGSNIEACNRLLVSLKDYFKNIIIISHVDAIKDVADNVIGIVRRDNHAYVKA